MDICPKCGKKQWNASSSKCYNCRVERTRDGRLIVPPQGYVLDPLGNLRTPQHSELKDGKIAVSYSYLLEEGATTLRGEHPKLAQPPRCAFPARLSCNYGDGFDRCEFMEHSGDHSGYGSVWTCAAGAKKRGKDKSDI